MGCLNVTVRLAPKPSVKAEVENRNDLSVDVVNAGNGLDVAVENKNTTPSVSVVNKNVRLNVTVALICRVSITEKYEYFYVTDGPFVVENGYFLVRRK